MRPWILPWPRIKVFSSLLPNHLKRKSYSQHWQSHNTVTQNTPLEHLVCWNNLQIETALGNHRSDDPSVWPGNWGPKCHLLRGHSKAVAGWDQDSFYSTNYPALWFFRWKPSSSTMHKTLRQSSPGIPILSCGEKFLPPVPNLECCFLRRTRASCRGSGQESKWTSCYSHRIRLLGVAQRTEIRNSNY